jgi:chromosome partitioning protein
MKIAAILNHKGGVGKTTFTGCTAQALALSGFRVLAIDNDSQHNLSSLLGLKPLSPNIRDIYKADSSFSPSQLLKAIRKTELPDLHIITASRDLCDSDVPDIHRLKQTMAACRLERFYDFILIDNAPGMDRLQASAIYAAQDIFVPTELKQFAVDGLTEMEEALLQKYPGSAKITKIIPNFYRSTKRQNTFVAVLNRLFPGKVTQTAIPVDPVFDEVVTDGKILFRHRLYSKGAAYYLKLVHELFELDEDQVWERMLEKRKEHISNEAKKRYNQSLTDRNVNAN